MKYLLVGLMLIAGALGHGRAGSVTPVHAFASAQFQTSGDGVATLVELDLNTAPGPGRIGLSIERTRQVCDDGSCRRERIISGYTYQNAQPGDALVASSLAGASVHATILFHDRVTNATFPVRVDAVWAATAIPARCATQYDQTGCDRAAVVTGAVTIGAMPVVAGQDAPAGLLQWRVPAW